MRLERGSAKLLILSSRDAGPRHSYELSKLIPARSGEQLASTSIPLSLLDRLEERAWMKASLEKPDERLRFYKDTAEGRRVLAQQRRTWYASVDAVCRVEEPEHA